MKNKYSFVRIRASRRHVFPCIMSTVVAFMLTNQKVQAQTTIVWNGAVNNVVSGAWGTSTNWTGSNVPDINSEIASFAKDWTGTAPTFALGANRTVNGVIFEDTGATGDLTGTIVSGSTLTLSGTNAFIRTTNSLAINTALAWGTTDWSKTGASTLTLSTANTGSGIINLDAGLLLVTHNSGLGTGTVTWGAGDTGRLQINGGVTIGNNLNISANYTGVGGVGNIVHAGTGAAQINGTITVNGQPSSGGIIQGGNSATNVLVTNGAINIGSAVTTMSQRLGFVRYQGGGSWAGTGVKDFLVGGTALLGANNGFLTDATLVMGQYGGDSGVFGLNGFDQSLAGIRFGGSGAADQGVVNIGTNTLTLTGGVSVVAGTTPNHAINGTTGSLNVGSTQKVFTIANTTSIVDLTVNAAITGTGGFEKAGLGTMAVNNTVQGAASVTAGELSGNGIFNGGLTMASGTTLTPGLVTTGATINASTLALNGATIQFNLGAGGDLINTTASGGLTTTGTNNFAFAGSGTSLVVATTYDLITYVGTSPGLSNFASVTLPGRAVGSLVDTGTAIAVNVTGNDRVRWLGGGALPSTWDVNTTANWQTVTGMATTTYLAGDDLLFDDNGTSGTTSPITLGVQVSPTSVEFANTSARNYEISGAGGIAGATSLVVNGGGNVRLTTANSYLGATSITNNSTLILDHDATGNVVLTGTSGVSVAAGSTLVLNRGDGGFTFNRNISGSGTVIIDAHETAATSTVAVNASVGLTGNNSSFSGTLKLSPTTGAGTGAGSFRLSSATATQLGSSTIDVDNGAQLWVSGGQTIANNITISGVGLWEAAGGTPATVATGADASSPALPTQAYGGIGAFRSEGATFTGTITLDGDAKIGAHGGTGTFTGNITNTNATDDLIIGGGTESHTIVATGDNSGLERIWINGGSITNVRTNTLQIGNNGTTGTLGSGDVILYTDISSAVLDIRRSDGYTLAQNVIAAHNGTATNLTKSTLRVNSTGTGVTIGANTVDLSDGTNGGSLVVGNTINGSILNINTGAVIEVGYFTVGEATGISGTVNQAGGSVAINGIAANTTNNLRIGHWGSNTSVYNMSGGTLSFNAGAPAATPSGGAELGGGIYVGIDGTGFFNQSGGTVSTNWVVLDNRGDTGVGTNMPSGVDQYNLSAGTLELKSTYGLIGRNVSTEFNFSGGTVRNTSGLDVAINSVTNVSGTGAILDTVTSGSKFSLMNDVLGSGTITTQGGGVIELEPDNSAQRTGVSTGLGTQTISAILAGTSAVTKIGAGTSTLSAANTYSGATTVSAGTLNLTGSINNSALTVATAATLRGEGSAASIDFGSGATNLLIDGSTGGAMTAVGALTGSGTVTVDYSVAPVGSSPIVVLNYGTTTMASGNFALVNASSYRFNTFTVASNQVTLDVGRKDLVWAGTTANWELIGSNVDWDLATDNFYSNDGATFNDTSTTNNTVAIVGIMLPAFVTVNSDTNNFVFNGSAGNAIGGAGALLKDGTSTLTLNAPNTYTNGTTLSDGEIYVQNSTALGSGAVRLGDINTGSANIELYIDTNRSSIGNAITVSSNATGTVTIGSRATVTGTGDDNQFTNITLQRDVIFDSNAADRTDYENIKGTGNVSIIGTGRSLFVTANPFVGNVSISPTAGGTLQIGVATAGNQNYIPDASNVTVNNTNNGTIAEFRLSAGGETIAGLSGDGNIDVNSINSTLTVGFGDATASFSGVMANNTQTLGLTKIGAGTQTLTGANTATGAINVSGGILQIGNGGATGQIAGATTLAAGATLTYNRTGAVNQPALNSAVAGAGIFNVNGDATTAVTLTAGGNFSGVVNVNSGSVIFAATNPTASGATAATYNLAAGTTLSNTGASSHGHVGNINMTGGSTWTTGSGTGSYNGENYQLNGTVTVAGGSVAATITREGTRTDANSGIALRGTRTFDVADVTGSAAPDLIVSTELEASDSDVGANQGALIKSGVGTMALNGVNTYTGTTIVSAGTLLINGSLGTSTVSAGLVSVASAATVGGTGDINGSISLDGNSFFTVADIADPMKVTGTVTFGAGFGIDNILGVDWDSLLLDTKYTLISDTTSVFSATTIENFGIANKFAVGSTGRFAYFDNGSLAVYVVPETSTTMLGAAGLLGLALRRRRSA